MLRLHHLGVSQSERIVWLLEELEIPFELIKHTRDPALSPQSLKDVPGNETGRSPFLEDTDAGITLGESNAIAEYILQKYGGGRLTIKPDDKRFADYLYWFNYSNSSMQPNMLTSMFLTNAAVPPSHPSMQFATSRLTASFEHMDSHLRTNKWLVGEEFTAADCMSVYPLTTQRYFGPLADLSAYGNLLRWLRDCSGRPAFARAMEKGDPEMRVLIDGKAPERSILVDGGVGSGIWRK